MSTLLRRWRGWLPLLLIMIAGAGLRYYRIGELPPGLYRDEAVDGLDALGITHGHLALFFAANNGREGLYMYLLAAGIALLGRTPLALRIVSATVGLLTLPAIYAAGRYLFSHQVGIFSAGVMAFTFWHLALSRVAFRAITLPLLLCVTVALGAYVVRRFFTEQPRLPGISSGAPALAAPSPRTQLFIQPPQTTASGIPSFWRTWPAALAGVSFGLIFYTYTAGQFVLALLVAFVGFLFLLRALHVQAYQWKPSPARRKAAWNAITFAVFGAVATFTPFAIWLVRHGNLYYQRAGEVSILNATINKGSVVGTLVGNVIKATGMFVYQGDRIWRHNLSLRPVFDGGIAIAFIIGVVACVWWLASRSPGPKESFRAPASLFLMLWLVIFLVPTILAEDTPHFLRAIGALPAACVVAAVGMDVVLQWLSRRTSLKLLFGRLCRVVSLQTAVAVLVLVIAAYSTVTDYFGNYVHQPMTAYWLENSNVVLAETVNGYVHSAVPSSLWLQDRLSNSNPALRFLSPDVEKGLISTVSVVAPPSSPITTTSASQIFLLVDPTHDWTPLRNALPRPSELHVTPGPLAQGDLDPAPHRAFIGVLAQPAQPVQPSITFERGIDVQQLNFELPRTSIGSDNTPVTLMPSTAGALTVTISWGTTRPITQDLAVFIHWKREGKVIAQHDGSPAFGYLPMPTWRVGDVIADAHPLVIPGGLQSGDIATLGIYDRASNRRLHVLDSAGVPLGDEVLIAVVQ